MFHQLLKNENRLVMCSFVDGKHDEFTNPLKRSSDLCGCRRRLNVRGAINSGRAERQKGAQRRRRRSIPQL